MSIKYKIAFRLKLIYWFLVRPKRQGVKCVLENNEQILMLRRNFGTDRYVFPGGAIHRGEPIEAAVKREIKEDLGSNLKEIEYIGVFTQEVHHRQETIHVFKSQVNPEDVNTENERIKNITWFDPGSLPELTPISKSVINQYFQNKI